MEENHVVCLPDCLLCALVSYCVYYKMLYTYLLGTSYLKEIEPDDDSGAGKYITMYLQRFLEKYEEEIGGPKLGLLFENFLKFMSVRFMCASLPKGQTLRVRCGEEMALLFQNTEVAGCAFLRPAVASTW